MSPADIDSWADEWLIEVLGELEQRHKDRVKAEKKRQAEETRAARTKRR